MALRINETGLSITEKNSLSLSPFFLTSHTQETTCVPLSVALNHYCTDFFWKMGGRTHLKPSAPPPDAIFTAENESWIMIQCNPRISEAEIPGNPRSLSVCCSLFLPMLPRC